MDESHAQLHSHQLPPLEIWVLNVMREQGEENLAKCESKERQSSGETEPLPILLAGTFVLQLVTWGPSPDHLI